VFLDPKVPRKRRSRESPPSHQAQTDRDSFSPRIAQHGGRDGADWKKHHRRLPKDSAAREPIGPARMTAQLRLAGGTIRSCASTRPSAVVVKPVPRDNRCHPQARGLAIAKALSIDAVELSAVIVATALCARQTNPENFMISALDLTLSGPSRRRTRPWPFAQDGAATR